MSPVASWSWTGDSSRVEPEHARGPRRPASREAWSYRAHGATGCARRESERSTTQASRPATWAPSSSRPRATSSPCSSPGPVVAGELGLHGPAPDGSWPARAVAGPSPSAAVPPVRSWRSSRSTAWTISHSAGSTASAASRRRARGSGSSPPGSIRRTPPRPLVTFPNGRPVRPGVLGEAKRLPDLARQRQGAPAGTSGSAPPGDHRSFPRRWRETLPARCASGAEHPTPNLRRRGGAVPCGGIPVRKGPRRPSVADLRDGRTHGRRRARGNRGGPGRILGERAPEMRVQPSLTSCSSRL